MIKITNRRKLNQFVVIPTFGAACGDETKGIHIYFIWLCFRLGIKLNRF